MTIKGREYLCKCNHDFKSCEETRLIIADYLSRLLKNSKITGYFFRTIRNIDDLKDEAMDDEGIEHLLGFIDRKYPFLYGIIGYNSGITDSESLDIEKKFNLIRTCIY